MAETTRLVRDDAYEEMGASYQCVLVQALDEALRENGVSDASVRQKVCESFLFGVGNFHDQHWFKAADERVFPLLCFSKTFLNVDTPVEELGVVYASSTCFAYHEYAQGAVEGYFSGDPAFQVETGAVGTEGDG